MTLDRMTARQFMEKGEGRRPDVVAPLASAGITALGGPVGQGKTLLALEICATKASGKSRIGLAAEAGPVLFVAADMAPEDYREYLPLVIGSREKAWDNLRIAPVRDLYLDSDEGAERLRHAIREDGIELVALDHFSSFLVTDGYTPKELRPILNTLADIRDIDKVPMLMLDQMRKKGNGSKASTAPAADELFGGRSKSALFDRILMINKNQASGVFTVTFAKERGSAYAPINLTFDGEGGWVRDESEQIHLTPGDQKVLAFIRAAPPAVPPTVDEIEEHVPIGLRAVRLALARLKSHNLIRDGFRRGRKATYRSVHCTVPNFEGESAQFTEDPEPDDVHSSEREYATA